MTEFDTHQPNPLDRMNVEEYQLPSYDDLTPEQQAQLREAGIGWVEHPAEMRPFATLEEFEAQGNNFYAYFAAGGFAAPVYRETSPYKRFELLHPDICDYLKSHVADNLFDDLSFQTLHDLRRAYTLMTQFVDTSDKGVVQDGVVADDYLCR